MRAADIQKSAAFGFRRVVQVLLRAYLSRLHVGFHRNLVVASFEKHIFLPSILLCKSWTFWIVFFTLFEHCFALC